MSDSDAADRSVDHPAAGAGPGAEMAGEAADEEKWPFGFILTIAMVSIYLAYRLIQGVVLIIDWIF